MLRRTYGRLKFGLNVSVPSTKHADLEQLLLISVRFFHGKNLRNREEKKKPTPW